MPISIYPTKKLLQIGALTLLLATALGLSSCASDSTDPENNVPPALDLECVRLGYPCSIAEIPADRLTVALNLLDGAWSQREAGTMAETLAWLKGQPEVIEAFGDDSAIRFRIENCVPMWLTDNSGLFEADPPAPRTEKGIVGEDTDDDGVVDNRDRKRALVMAPYAWQFQPHEESELLAGQLESLRGYEGEVTFKSNAETADQNITLQDYLHWNDYDLIYMSTHGRRVFDFGSKKSWVTVSTGVVWDFAEQTDLGLPGVVLIQPFTSTQTQREIELGLTADFFKNTYTSGLDNSLVMFSACETGDGSGSALADAMAGDNFVMFGWSEVVDSDDAFVAMSLLMEKLGEGLTAQQSLDAVDAAGLRSVVNSRQKTTVLQRFAPNGGDQRLYELPQLLDGEGEVLRDGVDLSSRVIGIVGDGITDGLALTVEVDGVTEENRGDFVLRYRFADSDLAGTFDLNDATETENFLYHANHEVDLGRDVEPGSAIPLEVVVELPEGGESRFHVDVDFNTTGSGGIHECTEYIPTPSQGEVAAIWADSDDEGSGGLGTPSDPGGGYWTVSASCEDPVNIGMRIRSGGGPATIFAHSMQGTTRPKFMTVSFEAAPGVGYSAQVFQGVAAHQDEYPINWLLNWRYTSVVDCYEPNQGPNQAKQLPLNIQNVTAFMIGGHRDNALHSEDYDDWYKLVVTEPSDVTVDLSHSPGDMRLRLRLWNAEIAQVAAAGSSVPGGGAIFTYRAQPGTYFLSVEAALLGVGAVNKFFDTLPAHFVSPYLMSVTTEPVVQWK